MEESSCDSFLPEQHYSGSSVARAASPGAAAVFNKQQRPNTQLGTVPYRAMGRVSIPGSVMLYTLQNISIEAKNVYPVNYFTQAIKNTLYIKNILVNTRF